MSNAPRQFSDYAKRLIPSAIRGLADMAQPADTITFGPGQPDATLFPLAEIRRSLDRILAEPATGQDALQYGPSQGNQQLRDMIAAYMSRRGVRCGREHVLLTNGSQQALHFVAGLLVNPGDAVAVQSPTYPGALQIFAARGAAIRSIEDVERDAAPKAALIYAMVNFHNPTGASYGVKERQALLALAEKSGAVIVEDDPYEVLRYQGEPLPPLLALDTRGRAIDDARAIYLGTFSKSVVPGFRIGWLVGPRDLVETMGLMKQTEDLQAGALAQACLADLFEIILSDHAPRLRAAYCKRRDTLVDALAARAGNLASWNVPEGGFFIWLTLREGIDTGAMLAEAARNGVTYVPGEAFFHDGRGANHLRLSYSSAPPERIGEGVERLVKTIRART